MKRVISFYLFFSRLNIYTSLTDSRCSRTRCRSITSYGRGFRVRSETASAAATEDKLERNQREAAGEYLNH